MGTIGNGSDFPVFSLCLSGIRNHRSIKGITKIAKKRSEELGYGCSCKKMERSSFLNFLQIGCGFLANVFLGYPFFYVLGYSMYNGALPLLGYILLVSVINFIFIRLRKDNWLLLSMVAFVLILSTAYIPVLIFGLKLLMKE
ncbi:hypothetical protein [Brevibacillus marinus]|uniref:hypothetical protein n=1 Tax=Brevibacillus marinus TaxID=2496837 RepID=UPI000F8167FF|nr:hypothetical protein [Brevibacillus marinus]